MCDLYPGSHFASGEFSGSLADIAWPLKIDNLMASKLSVSGMVKRYNEKTGNNTDGYAFFERIGTDEDVDQVLTEMCAKTAAYLYNLQSVLDVERTAIGGVSEQPALLKRIKEHYHRLYTGPFPLPCHEAEIVKCAFGNDSNLIGALY